MTALWRETEPLVLASTSATRRLLLESAALPFTCLAPDVDERAVEAAAGGLGPVALASRLADAKALAVSRMAPGRLVLGADQTLALGETLFHKPRSPEEAGAQIRALAGRTHHLHSAGSIARDGAIVARFAESAAMTMRPLDAAAVALYIDLAGEAATRSVGGYQLEGVGAHLFEQVEGNHSAILGLPILPLLAALRGLGALAL